MVPNLNLYRRNYRMESRSALVIGCVHWIKWKTRWAIRCNWHDWKIHWHRRRSVRKSATRAIGRPCRPRGIVYRYRNVSGCSVNWTQTNFGCHFSRSPKLLRIWNAFIWTRTQPRTNYRCRIDRNDGRWKCSRATGDEAFRLVDAAITIRFISILSCSCMSPKKRMSSLHWINIRPSNRKSSVSRCIN